MSGRYDIDAYAAAIFDVADDFLARRRVNGPRPRPLGPIRFLVVARNEGGRPRPLPRPAAMRMTATAGGYHAFFGRITDAGSGYRLAPGAYRARLEGEYYRPAEVNFKVFAPPAGHGLDLPVPPDTAQSAIRVNLRPALNYPFPARTTRLYGAFFYRDGQGQRVTAANTLVQAFDRPGGRPIAAATTDAAGSWLLIFPSLPAAGPPAIRLRFRLPKGGPVFEAPNVRIVPFVENSFPPRDF